MSSELNSEQSDGEGSADSERDPLVGQILAGRYRVLKLLGSGGMGAVYRAEHVHMRKIFALKVLHPEMTALEEAVKRFEREAIASSRIEHPHVIAATDFGRLDDGSFYLVLEYVDGISLSRVLHEQGALSEGLAIHIARQIASALGAAHRQGIVHRDLKPENIMLCAQGEEQHFVKVLDFGIAKLHAEVTGQSQVLTQAGAVFGTPEYMAPEQAAGEAVDARADLYALGIMLYEMVSGGAPFQSDNLMLILSQHLTAAPPPLPPSVSQPLSGLILRLLAKSPDERPASAEAVEVELRGLHALASEVTERTHVRDCSGGWIQALATLGPHVQRTAKLGSGVLHTLNQPLRLGALRLKIWQLGLSLALVVGLLAIRPEGAAPEGETEAARPGVVNEADSPSRVQTREAAARGEALGLEQLSALAQAEREPADWLALGLGSAVQGQGAQALASFERALTLDPTLRADPALLGHTRLLADAENYEPALNLAAKHLGAVGADLLFDVWASVREKTPRTIYAKQLLDDPALRAQASPALMIALSLREAESCGDLKALIQRAQSDADERALMRLRLLQSNRGCGMLGLGDCYGCLRGSTALPEAIEAAALRPKPRFALPAR